MLEDRIELPRLYMAWPSPALFATGDADPDLAADILANGKTSRLYRALVHDQRIAARGRRFDLACTPVPRRGEAELLKQRRPV